MDQDISSFHTFNPLEAIVFAGIIALATLAAILLLSWSMRKLHRRWHWFPDGMEGF